MAFTNPALRGGFGNLNTGNPNEIANSIEIVLRVSLQIILDKDKNVFFSEEAAPSP